MRENFEAGGSGDFDFGSRFLDHQTRTAESSFYVVANGEKPKM